MSLRREKPGKEERKAKFPAVIFAELTYTGSLLHYVLFNKITLMLQLKLNSLKHLLPNVSQVSACCLHFIQNYGRESLETAKLYAIHKTIWL